MIVRCRAPTSARRLLPTFQLSGSLGARHPSYAALASMKHPMSALSTSPSSLAHLISKTFRSAPSLVQSQSTRLNRSYLSRNSEAIERPERSENKRLEAKKWSDSNAALRRLLIRYWGRRGFRPHCCRCRRRMKEANEGDVEEDEYEGQSCSRYNHHLAHNRTHHFKLSSTLFTNTCSISNAIPQRNRLLHCTSSPHVSSLLSRQLDMTVMFSK